MINKTVSTPAEIEAAEKRSFSEIATLAGMTCAKLGQRFVIPRRTTQQWATGERTPPKYILLMMQEALGIIHKENRERQNYEEQKDGADCDIRIQGKRRPR